MLTNPALGALGATDPITFFSNLIPALLAGLLVVGVIVFIFSLIIGAVEYISAGGDKAKIETAKQKITNAIIGIVVLLSFFAILNLIECFFGIGLRGVTVGPFTISFSGTAICQ